MGSRRLAVAASLVGTLAGAALATSCRAPSEKTSERDVRVTAPKGPTASSSLPGDEPAAGVTKRREKRLIVGSRDVPAFNIKLDPEVFAKMQPIEARRDFKGRGVKARLQVNAESPVRITVALRGMSSLAGDRLNYDLRAKKPVQVAKDLAMSRMYLMSMDEDRDQFRLMFGYRVYRDLGAFLCHFAYALVSVNGEPQGLYALVEPPADAIRRLVPDAVAVYRRRYHQGFESKWEADVANRGVAIGELRRFLKGEGKGGARELEKVLDVDGYLSWLAANSILKNEDHLDELFLYEVRPEGKEPGRLRVMGWDFEDLDAKSPKKGAVDSELYFSALGPLDHIIAKNAQLSRRYEDKLRELLQGKLSTKRIAEHLLKVRKQRDRADRLVPASAQRQSLDQGAMPIKNFEIHIGKRQRELHKILGVAREELPREGSKPE